MEHVLTLIGNPENRDLDGAIVAAARTTLTRLGARAKTEDWLAPGVAVDVPFAADGDLARPAAAALRRDLAGFAADIAVQPANGRRKRLLVADMESTIIRNEMLDELADFVGMRDEVAEITRRAMNGELDFAAAVRARVALLKGLPASVLDEADEARPLMPGARALVATMRAHGAYAALVSGGFSYFTSRVRQLLGFDFDQANELDVADGTLAGTVREPILDKDAKLDALKRAGRRARRAARRDHRGRRRRQRPADAPGRRPRRRLPRQAGGAQASELRIDHGDLTALLYLQGYRESAFAP